jgi:hypothetical protein
MRLINDSYCDNICKSDSSEGHILGSIDKIMKEMRTYAVTMPVFTVHNVSFASILSVLDLTAIQILSGDMKNEKVSIRLESTSRCPKLISDGTRDNDVTNTARD